jgi:predicted exporter
MVTGQRLLCMKNKRWLILLVWFITILLVTYYLSSKLQVVSDITQFMPDYSSADHRYALFLDELNHGQTSKILFVRLNASTPEELAKLSQSLKGRMIKSGLFKSVVNGEVDYDIRDFEELFKYRYLLSTSLTKSTFGKTNLEHNLAKRLDEIRAGMGMILKQTIESDPTNTFIEYLRNTKSWQEPILKYGVWFTRDRKSALLIARTDTDGFNLSRQNDAIELIHQSIKELRNGLQVTVDISGPGVFAVATRDRIKQTLTVLSAWGGCLILLIMLLAYRSLILIVLVGIPLFTAILTAILVTNVIFGHIHGITLAFGITLLGVCLDYPVHFFSHLRHDQSATDTIKTIWPTLRLGVITTGLGYLVLLWSGFSGLSQLAVFAVVGLGIALILTRWVLPEWIPEHYHAHYQTGIMFRVLESKWRSRFGIPTVIAVCIVITVLLLLHKGRIWEQDIAALSPIPEDARMLDQQLRHQLGVPDVNYLFILTNNNPEILLQETEEFVSNLAPLMTDGIVRHIYSPTDVLPSQARQLQRQTLLPEKAELEASVKNATQHMPFKPDIFSPFIQAVENSRYLQPLTWQDIQTTPLAKIVDSDFFKQRNQWISIIRLGGIIDKTALEKWLQNHPEVKSSYLNLHQTASRIIRQYQRKAVYWLASGGVVMVLVLLIFTKSFGETMRIILAPILAVIFSLGIQVLFGMQLNLFHLLSALLIVGIGVDYSLFFNRTAKDKCEQQQSLHGVIVSASSTLVAFGILVFSEIPVMQAIGQTVAIGVFTCFVFALFLAKRQKHI